MQKLDNIKSVLIIRSGALGDTVYATVILDALIKQFGEDIKIDWIGAPLSKALFKFDTRINNILLLKHRRLPLLINPEKLKIVFHSIKEPYDLLINLEHGSHFSNLAKVIKATTKVGDPYTKPTVDPLQVHVTDSLKDYCTGIISKEVLIKSYPKLLGEENRLIKNKFSLPDTYIVINPSNSHTNRNKINYRAWPVERWKELINAIDPSENIVLIGNRGEEDYFDNLKPFSKNIIDLSGQTQLPELISIIEHAKFLITTDTGPAHIASATSTPIYCLIGPTRVTRTGPYKTPFNEVHIITKNLDCSPCYNTLRMKNCTDNICMKEITVHDVLKSLQKS